MNGNELEQGENQVKNMPLVVCGEEGVLVITEVDDEGDNNDGRGTANH